MTGDQEQSGGSVGSTRQRLAYEIRRRRKAAGLSQPHLGKEVGYSRQYISSAENAQHGVPSLELVLAIDRRLEAGGELVNLRKAAQLEAYAIRNDLTGLVGVGSARPDGYVDSEEDDVKRRMLLGLLGQVAVASPLVERLEEVRRGLDEVLPETPTERDADDWEHAVLTYAHEVGLVPAARVLGDLVADFAEIKRRIDEASGLLRMRLIHSGAQLAALTAISLSNLRKQRSAERWWRTATRAAEGAVDPKLAALVTGRQAIFSLHTASAPRVVALADAAVARGEHAPCVGVISGLAARAQILSEVGRHAEAGVALHQVTDMFERLPESALTDQRSQWNWAEQRLHHVESHVHAHAGRVNQTRAAQEAASTCYPASNYQGRAQVAMNQALAFIRAGDVGSGADQLASVFDGLESWQRTDGLVLRSGEAVVEKIPMEMRKNPRVSNVAEMINDLAST
jgi:transcriptional regulator with XRE-family HTH domain